MLPTFTGNDGTGSTNPQQVGRRLDERAQHGHAGSWSQLPSPVTMTTTKAVRRTSLAPLPPHPHVELPPPSPSVDTSWHWPDTPRKSNQKRRKNKQTNKANKRKRRTNNHHSIYLSSFLCFSLVVYHNHCNVDWAGYDSLLLTIVAGRSPRISDLH